MRSRMLRIMMRALLTAGMLLRTQLAAASDLYLYDGGYREGASTGPLFGRDIYSPLLGGTWAGGEDGVVLRDPGGGFEVFTEGWGGEDRSVADNALYAPLLGGRYAVGEGGTIWRDVGGGWEAFLDNEIPKQPTGPSDPLLLYSAGAPLRGGSFAVGRTCSFRKSGLKWIEVEQKGLNVTAVVRTGGEYFASALDGKLARWNRSSLSWNVMLALEDGVDLLCIDADDVTRKLYVGGERGRVFEISLASLAVKNLSLDGSLTVRGISALNGQSVWAVGSEGLVGKWNGSWYTHRLPSSIGLNGITTSFLDVAVVAGDLGSLFQCTSYDGCVSYNVASNSNFTSVSSDGSRVFVVGTNATVFSMSKDNLQAGFRRVSVNANTNFTSVYVGSNNNQGILIGDETGQIFSSTDGLTFVKESLPRSCGKISSLFTVERCLFYGDEIMEDGAPLLRLQPDFWHSPSLNLYCDGGVRTDFRMGFQTLEFLVRAGAGTDVWPTFKLSTWDRSSEQVSIALFVEGGKVDSSWRKVVIPLTDLSNGWDLGNVERLIWGNMTSGNLYVKSCLLPGTQQVVTSTAFGFTGINETFNDVIVFDTTVISCGQLGTIFKVDLLDNSWSSSRIPSSPRLNKISASSSLKSLHVVGHGTTLLRGDKDSWNWTPVPLPAEGDLYSVSFADDMHGWVVGQQKSSSGGIIFFFDGASWTVQFVTSQPLFDVHALSTESVLACGGGGGIYRLGSGGWVTLASSTSSSLRGIVALSSTEQWAVGDDGVVLKSDGAAWSRWSFASTSSFTSISASPDSDVIIGAADGSVLQVGPKVSGRTVVMSLPRAQRLLGVHTSGVCLYKGDEVPGEGGGSTPALRFRGDMYYTPSLRLYCGGRGRVNMCSFDTLQLDIRKGSAGGPAYPTLKFSSFSSQGREVAVGAVDGTWRQVVIPLLEFAVGDWRLFDVELLSIGNTSTACSVAPSGYRPAACEDILVRNVKLSARSSPSSLCSDILLLKDGIARNVSQASFTPLTFRSMTRPLLASCSAVRPMFHPFCISDAQLWGCGERGLIAKLDPHTLQWSVEQHGLTNATLNSIFAITANTIWAVGARGVILKYSPGTGWLSSSSSSSSSHPDLHGVTATADNRAWVVGADGTILMFDGSKWIQETSPVSSLLLSVASSVPDDFLGIEEMVFAVGVHGTLLRRLTSGSWLELRPSVSHTLFGVWVKGPEQAFAVGGNGTVLRWNGSDWLKEEVPTKEDLFAVDGDKVGTAVVVGAGGTVLSWHWSHTFMAVESGTSRRLLAVNARAGCAFFGREVQQGGYGGGRALLFSPDHWHVGSLRLYCGTGVGRRDLSKHDALSFLIRSPDRDPAQPVLRLSTWDRSSRDVNLSKYVAGGLVDGEWKRVRIPLDDLRTPDWKLGGVETIVLLNTSVGCNFAYPGSYGKCNHYLLDDITVLDETAPYPTKVQVETSSIIMIQMNEPYDIGQVKNLTTYKLQSSSTSSPSWSARPLEVGISYSFTGFSPGSLSPENDYLIYLRFNLSLPELERVDLSISGLSDESGNRMLPFTRTLTWSRTQSSRMVKVNMQGYLPVSRKIGYVGGWIGDLGGQIFAVSRSGAVLRSPRPSLPFARTESSHARKISAVAAIREDHAVLVGEGGLILELHDEVWEAADSPSSSDLLDVKCGISGFCFAIGRNCTILQRPPGRRRTWKAMDVGCSETLLALWVGPLPVHDKTLQMVAVGEGGRVVWWTENDGVSFLQLGNETLRSIDSRMGQVIVGGDGGFVSFLSYGKWISCRMLELRHTSITSLFSHPVTRDIWAGTGDGSIVLLVPNAADEACVTVQSWQRKAEGIGGNGAILSISPVSMEYCGYYPMRKGCVSLLAIGQGGKLLSWPGDVAYPSWTELSLFPDDPLIALCTVQKGPVRLPLDPPTARVVRNDTLETVLEVPLKLVAANWHLSGEDVYQFDFSSLSSQGFFRVLVDHLGSSEVFSVNVNSLDFAAYTTARALFYQRCGHAGGVSPPFADPRFQRPACHLHDSEEEGAQVSDGVYHESIASSPLYAGEELTASWKDWRTTPLTRDMHGGHHDAGDFNKYMPSAGEMLWYLLLGLDLDPQRFADDVWDIPESGNNVPDLLDEIKWETDFWLRVMADDGGMYHKVSGCNFFQGLPHLEPTVRYAFARTTHDTAIFAAVMASAARAWKPYNSSLSDAYLHAAELAWEFLLLHPESPVGGFKNPPGSCGGTGEYNDEYDGDNRLWAAAELYRTTGKEGYHTYFKDWYSNKVFYNGNSGSGTGHYTEVYWAYVMSDHPDVDKKVQQDLTSILLSSAYNLAQRHEACPYRSASRLDVASWVGWGSFTYGSRDSLQMLMGWRLNGDQSLLLTALANLDSQYGANPLSFSFVTGLGVRSPRRPTCVTCMYDDEEEPYPGIPVFGPFAHLSNGHPYYSIVQHDANNFPYLWNLDDAVPILRRYIDEPKIIPESEYSIGSIAHTLVAVNFFASFSGGPRRFFFDSALLLNRTDVPAALSRRRQAGKQRQGKMRSVSSAVTQNWIEIKLERPATRAASTHTTCTEVFDDSSLLKLGTDAACYWKEDGLSLFIGLGSDHSLRIGDTLSTRKPAVGFDNSNTMLWEERVYLWDGRADPCILLSSWVELGALARAMDPSSTCGLFVTGGMGAEMTSEFEVWLCADDGPGLAVCPSTALCSSAPVSNVSYAYPLPLNTPDSPALPDVPPPPSWRSVEGHKTMRAPLSLDEHREQASREEVKKLRAVTNVPASKEWACFRYHEPSGEWRWWGFNSELQLVKQDETSVVS